MNVAEAPVQRDYDDNLQLLRRYHATEDEKERADLLTALTERNTGLVHSIAARYKERLLSHPGVEYEDLVQIGTLGMLRAVRSFDFSFGTAFSTYAVPLIIGEIRRCLRDDGSVRVSRDVKQRGYRVLKAREDFCRCHGREPSTGELAAASGEPPELLVFLLDATAPVSSLSAPLAGGDGDGDVLTQEDVLCDDDDAVASLTEHLTLQNAIAKLCERDRMIIRLRYEKELSQQQTADILGLSQVKVSRTEKKIFAFLREEMG